MSNSSHFTKDDLYKSIQSNFKSWHRATVSPGLLEKLAVYQQLAEEGVEGEERVAHRLLQKAMEHLEGDFSKEVQLLRRRYLLKESAYQIASDLGWAESSLYRKQSEAIERLAEVVANLEKNVVQDTSQKLMARLEAPTYTQLVGAEEHLDVLTHNLVTEGPPWIYALEGIGGIGKTSLADALARQLIERERTTDIGWVTARESQFDLAGTIQTIHTPLLSIHNLLDALAVQLIPELAPGVDQSAVPLDVRLAGLEQRLKRAPHIVFIDNLETVDEVRRLVPKLRSMAGPTKFVLTTRTVISGEPDIYYFEVPELSLTNTLALIRQEGRLGNLPHLVSALDAELLPIWEMVGGNPLAIRLITGQTRIHTLDSVLDELQQAKGKKAEQFYAYIFSGAWENLDEQTRQVLLAMPLLTERGGGIERLSRITELESADVAYCLDRLVALNLVDSRGGLNERLYTIHNLTRTFLQEQVAKWR